MCIITYTLSFRNTKVFPQGNSIILKNKNEDLSADLRVFKCNTVLTTLPVAKIVLRCPQKSE